jgi:hypothetical protein
MRVQATSAFLATAAIAQSPSSRQTPAVPAAETADTVTISPAARAALFSSGGGGTPAGAYPLEYYSIPQWQADLMPVVLSGKLGGKGGEGMYERGGNLVGKYDSELSEYGKLFDSHLKAILQQEGITTTPEYHQAMIVDKESSEKIRSLMTKDMAGDKRMTELMKTLGIPLPG